MRELNRMSLLNARELARASLTWLCRLQELPSFTISATPPSGTSTARRSAGKWSTVVMVAQVMSTRSVPRAA